MYIKFLFTECYICRITTAKITADDTKPDFYYHTA